MALAPCYECGQEISSQAVACPYCGAPAKQAAPFWANPVVWILVVVLLLGINLLLGSGGGAARAAAGRAAADTVEASAGAAASAAPAASSRGRATAPAVPMGGTARRKKTGAAAIFCPDREPWMTDEEHRRRLASWCAE